MSVRPQWGAWPPTFSLPAPGAASTAQRGARPGTGAPRWAAKWVSRVASPPLTAMLMLARVADGPFGAHPAAWLVAFAVPAIGAPALVVAALVKAGRVTDLDLSDRRQRPLPFAVATACAMATTVSLAWLNAPPALTAFGVAWSALVGLLSLVTLRWKISLHAAAAGALGGLALTTGGPGAAAWLALPVVVGWARVVLCKHTPRQVVAGAAVGATAILAAWPYL